MFKGYKSKPIDLTSAWIHGDALQIHLGSWLQHNNKIVILSVGKITTMWLCILSFSFKIWCKIKFCKQCLKNEIDITCKNKYYCQAVCLMHIHIYIQFWKGNYYHRLCILGRLQNIKREQSFKMESKCDNNYPFFGQCH